LRTLFALLLLTVPVMAQAPNHPNHGADHFYATWMMPSDRTRSCCNLNDCGAAEAKRVNGKWYARWTKGGKPRVADISDLEEWIEIPENTVERDRDLPDGGAHLCASRIMNQWNVLCFAAGAGG
jgi:hypothetical protein